MNRSGVMHTIEAVLAGTILFVFVVAVMPRLDVGTDPAPTIDEQTRQALATLDAADWLRPAAVAGNASGIADRLETIVGPRQVAVSLRWINATAATVETSKTYTRNISINASTVEQVTARIWLYDVSDPDVSFGDTTLYDRSGTVREAYISQDVSGVGSGQVLLNITVSGQSRIGYSIDVANSMITRQPPVEDDVHAASYVLAGDTDMFHPMEVTALVWQ